MFFYYFEKDSEMYLITVNEWLGPGHKMNKNRASFIPAEEKQFSLASRLPLNDALTRLRKYQEAYNDKYNMAVNFRVLSIAEVDEIYDCVADLVGIENLDTKPQSK